jgi:protein-tyrosine phosphatase
VQPDFLHAALEALETDYGGMEGYLREGLGLGAPERERLRALYLEPGR